MSAHSSTALQMPLVGVGSMPRRNWTESELVEVLDLYRQISFGSMHSRNQDIIALAERIGRTPNAVALKMVNFASLDPSLDQKGMANVSRLDRQVWDNYQRDKL
jgi:putative restriction endonuclease